MTNKVSTRIEYGSKTDKGRVKDKNEDNLGFFETRNGKVMVLCDGMGGHYAGAHASGIAVDCIREYFDSNTYDDLNKALEDAIKYANSQIFDESKDNDAYLGMGTTCVLCLIKDDLLYYAHVGDSRLYLYDGKKLQKLTKDHTYVQQLIDNEEISEEDAVNHPRKNELIRAVGVSFDIEVDVNAAAFKPADGNVMMACSDGLYSMVNENTIEYILNQKKSAQFKAEKLTELAIKEGGYDNITVQIVEFSITNEKVADTVNKEKKTFLKLLQKYIPFFKKYPQAIFGVYALIILLATYATFDMFFKSSKTPILSGDLSLEDSIALSNPEAIAEDTIAVDAKNNNKSKQTTETKQITETKPVTKNETKEATHLTYTVRKGDALSLLSQRFNVKVDKLMQINKLSNIGIRVGQQIKIPLQAIYTVKQGDNLYDIAKKYNISRTLIRNANKLKSDTDIYVGSNLYIPYP